MSNPLINDVKDQARSIYNDVLTELRSYQSTPVNTRPMSGHEQAAQWQKLKALPPEIFDETLNQAAAAHPDGEPGVLAWILEREKGRR